MNKTHLALGTVVAAGITGFVTGLIKYKKLERKLEKTNQRLNVAIFNQGVLAAAVEAEACGLESVRAAAYQAFEMGGDLLDKHKRGEKVFPDGFKVSA